MSRQLDILALEPFYGGARRIMLEKLIHHSRHRWTLLKLPPRRIERRLSAAAHWFAEQLSRHWVGRVDLLFTSEALNLSDLHRFTPQLQQKPSVVYFHSNQLPYAQNEIDSPLDLVNLNTAAAATEIWFNSLFHLRVFMAKAQAMVHRHSELSSRDPMLTLQNKSVVMYPPIASDQWAGVSDGTPIRRDRRTLFIDTRDADVELLNSALSIVKRRGEPFNLVTVGPVEQLSPDFQRLTIPEMDDRGQLRGLLQSSVFLSGKIGAVCDHHAVRAMQARCWPLVPRIGVYHELLPEALHKICMYDEQPDEIAAQIQDAFFLEKPSGYEAEMMNLLARFDPIKACSLMDDRFEHVANTTRRP
jgi:hypothetical protein